MIKSSTITAIPRELKLKLNILKNLAWIKKTSSEFYLLWNFQSDKTGQKEAYDLYQVICWKWKKPQSRINIMFTTN